MRGEGIDEVIVAPPLGPGSACSGVTGGREGERTAPDDTIQGGVTSYNESLKIFADELTKNTRQTMSWKAEMGWEW